MFSLNSTDDEEAIAAVAVAPMAVDLTEASEAAPAAPDAELETSAQLEEIIGEEVDAPARAALLEEAGGNVQVAIDNYLNQILGRQAAWEPTVGGACEARFRGDGRIPGCLLPKDCWYKGVVEAAHVNGT